jgi:hypothetical protein
MPKTHTLSRGPASDRVTGSNAPKIGGRIRMFYGSVERQRDLNQFTKIWAYALRRPEDHPR